MYYTEPFPHAYVENALPEDVYQRLIDWLPPTSEYALSGYHPSRYMINLGQPKYWDQWKEEMSNLVFPTLQDLLRQFGLKDLFDYTTYVYLVRDLDGYDIPPHTDIPQRVMSVFYYLPPDDSLSKCGTSLCETTIEDFTNADGTWFKEPEDVDKFKIVKTMEFKRNTMFAFPRTDNSFHCVPKINNPNIIRNSLLVMVGVT